MARRPIFVAGINRDSIIDEVDVEFQWYPGMAKTQKQKSVQSLHKSAASIGLDPVLEISSKSLKPLGIDLSAFNLRLKIFDKIHTTVESAYQGSKVFANGGPYTDLFHRSSREAKKDERLVQSGALVGFRLGCITWKLFPKTAFYDWLYINALAQNKSLSDQIVQYNSFSDIEFNPKKQVNCQARSAAYFVSLSKLDLLRIVLDSKDEFVKLYGQNDDTKDQLDLGI